VRTCWPAAAVLSLLVVLPGCSDDPEPTARPTPTASASASPSPSPSTASAGPTASATRTAAAADAPVVVPAPSAPARPTSAPARTAAPPAPASPAPGPARAARLTGDGLDLPSGVLPFGTTVQAALPALTAALGSPTRDTGAGPSFGVYGTCPGTALRALEFGGGALVLLFGGVPGPALTLYGWRLTPTGSAAGLPRASALVGDAATFDVGVGTSVTALRDGAGEAVQISAGDEVVGPSFRVQDQSSGLFGSLSAATPRGTVTSVQAGRPCGD
jgi:hypothetical protein